MTVVSLKPAAELGWVIYGSSPEKRRQMHRWEQWLAISQKSLILNNNNSHSLQNDDEMAGNNQYFEFSAYRQLCDLFSGEGPFIIVNDTMFTNHWQWAWAKLCKRAVQKMPHGQMVVYGDVRIEGGTIPERPNIYLASWIFIIPDRHVLRQFSLLLDSVMLQRLPDPSPSYRRYIDEWIHPPVWYKGWHGQRNQEAINRKIRCVVMEHLLSKRLAEYGLRLQNLGQFRKILYALVRIVDRLVTRIIAVTGQNGRIHSGNTKPEGSDSSTIL